MVGKLHDTRLLGNKVDSFVEAVLNAMIVEEVHPEG